MRNLETFDWLVIVLLAALLISRLVKKPGSKPGKEVIDEKSDTVEVSDTTKDEESFKAD